MLVEVDNVSKVYEPSPPLMRLLLRTAIRSPIRALTDVSLSLDRGEILAVVGPNGAGKSTLFRVLTGLTTPTRGRATIAGLDVTTASHRVRRLIGFAPAEERTLLLRHTCFENLRFHGQMQGMERQVLARRIDEVLEFTGLSAARNQVGFALSTGMRARLQLARAMLHSPRVLILDEPTGAIDPVAASELLQVIKQLASDGIAILISSHRLEEIQALHDRVVLINRGQIIYAGDLDALRDRWQKPRLLLEFHNGDNAAVVGRRLASAPDLRVARQDGAELVLVTDVDTGGVLARLGSDIGLLKAIRPVTMPLMELLAEVLADDNARSRTGAQPPSHEAGR